MKRLIAILTAAALLTGCGAANDDIPEKSPAEEAAAAETETEAVTTEKTTSTTTANKTVTTTSSSTAEKKTTVTTTAKASGEEETDDTPAPAEEDDAPVEQTPEPEETDVPAVTTLSAEADPSVADMTAEEWKAIDKLKEKYGSDLTVTNRYLCWEFWGTEAPEVLDVLYTVKDGNGLVFQAYGKENTDTITSDSYVYSHYTEQFRNEAAESFKKLVPEGKVWIVDVRKTCLPFGKPADMTYEEFRQAFADNGGNVLAYIYVTEDMEVSEEMKEYSSKRGDGKKGELGYIYMALVNSVSQEDYDRLDDIITGPPGSMDQKTIN